MFLIQIACPAGFLDPDDQERIARDIPRRMKMVPGAAPGETFERARRMLHVAFHEATTWCTGDGPVDDGQPPPFVVTVTLPEAWREEFSSHGISAIGAALEAFDTERGFVRPGGDVWVNVVGVADGSIGLNGSATDAIGVVNYMTEGYRAAAPAVPASPDGVVLDPICGMRVALGPRAITLQHGEDILGFCSTGCRAAYADTHQLAVP
jgi:hypothetical protein